METTRRIAKKALAVVSAAALMMTCGATGVVSGFASTGITAYAASASVAIQLKIFDDKGNEMGDNPIIYLDNSEAAGADSEYHNITKSITVVASNDNGVTVDDEIRYFVDTGATDFVDVHTQRESKKIITTLSGGKYVEKQDGSLEWQGKKSGTTHLYFTTSSGEVYRSVTVVVYKPATDMKVFLGANKSQLSLNENNTSNSASVMTIANHKYQFLAEKIPADSTDEVEWAVYEGDYEGQSGQTPKATNKAEITANGLFTPKSNGSVTIAAKYKATETTPRNYALGDKVVSYVDSEGKTVNETLHDYPNVPKYIHVLIVKENPAKSLKITNAPDALEVGETAQLQFEATPTYTGTGYETGATDEFKWTSSNTNVAKVDEKGLVTAVGKGDAKIIISGENENVTAEIDLKVLTKATSISFPVKTISTRVGVSTSIKAIMSPVTADDEIEWTSSNPAIATVKSTVDGAFTNEQTAVITGVKKGTVTITARAKNSGVEARITCNVENKILSSDINLSREKDNNILEIVDGSVVQVYDQHQITINGSLVSSDGSSPDDTIEWKVIGNGENNGDYVTIDSTTANSIKLTGFARGTVTVKASSKADPSITKSFELKVLKKATKGTIVEAETNNAAFSKTVNVGTTMALKGNIMIDTNQPYDHDDRVVRWESSNESAFVVDNTGFLKAVGNGTSTIKMITDSGYSLTTSLTAFTTSSIVIKNVTTYTDGSLPTAEILLNNQMTGSKALTAQVKNERDTLVSNVALQWTSDNEAVATVNSNGLVTGHSIGEAKITVKSGNKTDTCIIKVCYPLSSSTVTVGNVYYSPYVTSYEPEVKVVAGAANSENVIELVKDVDYTVTYTNNTTVNQTATITVTGIGNYTGSVSRTFRINARPLNDAEITIDPIDDQELTADNKTTGVMPEIRISQLGYPLVKDTDYTANFVNNRITGVATINITGKGNYNGNNSIKFNIYCKHTSVTERVKTAATCINTGVANVVCNLCNHTTEKVLPLVDHKFVKTSVVAPTYDSDGYTLYTCSVCKETEKREPVPALKRVPVDYLTITADKTTFTSTGQIQIPRIKVTYKKTVLRENTDYTLSYSNKNSKDAGSYTVKVICREGYTGTYTINYKILPVATVINLNKTDVTITAGEIVLLTPSTVPADAVPTVKWTTSNQNVAKVSENGKVTAVGKGVAVITAISGTARATCNVTVEQAPFNNYSVISSESIKLGQSTVITALADGAKEPYEYAAFYKKTGTTKWTCVKSYSSESTIEITPKNVASYDVRVKIKDADGNVANKDFDLTVNKALANTSKISDTTVTLGDSVFALGSAEGGDTAYEYAVFYKKVGTSKWTCVQSYDENRVVEITPKNIASYNVRVKVKDANGTVSDKNFTIKCIKPLESKTKISSNIVTLGESATINCSAAGGEGPYKYEVLYKKSISSTWTKVQSYSENADVTITPKNVAPYDVQVKIMDSKGREVVDNFTIKSLKKLENKSTVSSEKVVLGNSITVKCAASGGEAPYQFAVFYKKTSDSSWTRVQNYSDNTTVTVTPKAATTYTVRVKMKDANGTVVNKDFTVKSVKELINNSKLSSDKIIVGSTVTVTGAASGGEGSYQYAVFYKKASDSKWTCAQSYKTTKSVKITPKSAVPYDVRIKVKDAGGNVTNKDLTLTVVTALKNTSKLSSTNITFGSQIIAKCSASGGEGTYQYAVFYRKSGTSNWTCAQSYKSTANVIITPKAATEYEVRVKVKDGYDNVVNKDFTVTVTK